MSVTDLPIRPADASMGPTAPGSTLPAAERAAVIFAPHPKRRLLAVPRPLHGFFSAGTLHIVLGALAFVMMAPFVWMVLTSLKSADEIDNPNWLPHNKTFVAADGSKSVRPDFQWQITKRFSTRRPPSIRRRRASISVGTTGTASSSPHGSRFCR